jgi:hypothetical protein
VCTPSKVLITAAIALLGLAGCGGVAAPAGPAATAPTPTEAVPTPAPRRTAVATAPPEPCAAGRLTVGDLAAIHQEWVAGVEAATERAVAWRADARLVQLRVACGVLEPTFRWQGTFYSEAAQSFFLSDTEETEPAEVDPVDVPTLPTGGLDFLGLQRALARAGFADETELSATNGVEIRLNTDASPFGPPEAPKNVVYYHVALHNQGELRDVFVHADAWIPYLYSPVDRSTADPGAP